MCLYFHLLTAQGSQNACIAAYQHRATEHDTSSAAHRLMLLLQEYEALANYTIITAKHHERNAPTVNTATTNSKVGCSWARAAVAFSKLAAG